MDEKQLRKIGQFGEIALTIPRHQKQVDTFKLHNKAVVSVMVYGRDDRITANFAFRNTTELG